MNSWPIISKLAGRARRPAVYDHTFPTVSQFEWRPAGGAINFGDHLATIVTAKMLANANQMAHEETVAARRLFTVGSVLHLAETGDTVWGSGVNGKIPEDRHRFTALDVRAVRGPKTAEFLRRRGIAAPDVFGDPALLVPTLFPGRFRVAPVRPVLFIPNLHDTAAVRTDLPTISPLRGWNRVIEAIVGAELVVASSLHGVVLAEAFGVPARYVRLSEEEHSFKYDDYAQGTGRDQLEPARSIAEAIEMGGMSPIQFNPEKLMAAFPLDIWR